MRSTVYAIRIQKRETAIIKAILYRPIQYKQWGVAQMGTHMIWVHEIAGSSPVTPTIERYFQGFLTSKGSSLKKDDDSRINPSNMRT